MKIIPDVTLVDIDKLSDAQRSEFRKYDKMDTGQLAEHFYSIFEPTPASIMSGALMVRALDGKGHQFRDDWHLPELLRKVLAGSVIPEIISECWGQELLQRTLSNLNPDDQTRIVHDGGIEILERNNGNLEIRIRPLKPTRDQLPIGRSELKQFVGPSGPRFTKESQLVYQKRQEKEKSKRAASPRKTIFSAHGKVAKGTCECGKVHSLGLEQLISLVNTITKGKPPRRNELVRQSA